MGKYSSFLLDSDVPAAPTEQRSAPRVRYSSSLLDGDEPGESTPETVAAAGAGPTPDELADVFGDTFSTPEINQEWTPSSTEVDARTGQPVQEWTPTGDTAADLLTHVKTGFVDDKKTKLAIYAADRFPDLPEGERLSRYGIVNNEIVYLGDDGKVYPETKNTLGGAVKRGAGEAVAKLPAGVMGAMGSAAGPGIAALGAAGGEGIRKTVGNAVFDEPQTSVGNVGSMAFEAGAEFVGERLGRALVGAANTVKMRKAGDLKKAAVRGLDKIGPARRKTALDAVEAGQEHGVDLLPHQAFESPGMRNQYAYLRQATETADSVADLDKRQAEQVSDAFTRFVDDGVSPGRDPYNASQELAQAADDAVRQGVEERTAGVAPLYKEAAEEAGEIDVTSLIGRIDTAIDTAKGPAKTALKKYRRDLTREIPDSAPTVEQGLADKINSGLYGNGMMPEDRFGPLDSAKKSMDKFLNGPEAKTAIDADARREIAAVNNELKAVLDKASPKYKEARRAYEVISPEVEDLKSGIVGQLGKQDGEKVTRVIDMLYKNPDLTPTRMAKAKEMISAQSPQAWKDIYYMNLRRTFTGMKVTEAGEVANPAGKLYKQIWGHKPTRDLLKAAAPTQLEYRNLERFMGVLKRAGFGHGKESMTATFQEISEDMGSRTLKAASSPIGGLKRATIQTWDKILAAGDERRLFEALATRGATEKLAAIKRISPEREKFWKQLGAFLAPFTVSDGVRGAADALSPENRPIPAKTRPRQ